MSGMAEILDENTALRATLASEREVVAMQATQLEQQATLIEQQAAQLAELTAKVEAVMASNEQLQKLFEYQAAREKMARSERFEASAAQTHLFEDGDIVVPPRDPEVQASDESRPKKREEGRKDGKHPRKGRRKGVDLEALGFPKRRVDVPVAESTCGTCHKARRVVGETVSYRVAWVPGHFEVHEVHREQCGCDCPESGVWAAPEPYLLPRALCDNSLLARVIVDKAGDHLPLHRQAKRLTREGFPVGSNVLAGWFCQAADQVAPLVKALHDQVLQSPLVQSDDSGFPVQDGDDGKLRKGRIWVATDQKQVAYLFSPTKEGEHPAAWLAPAAGGTLVADGGSEYNEATRVLDLTRAGCWSHLRRYFYEASVQHEEATTGLIAIRDIFLIERDLVDKPPDQRLAERRRRAKPIVDGFFRWVREVAATRRPSSKFGEAVGYALSQEQRMRVFLDDPAVPIHNNLSELMLRQPIVGRKNWLFARSEGGAKAACDFFSLIGSCMLQGLDPAAYLYDVFCRLPSHPAKWVHELTPLNWRLALDAGDIELISPPHLG